MVALPEGWSGAQDAQGNALPVQTIGDILYTDVAVPASGWTTLAPAAPEEDDVVRQGDADDIGK